MAAFGERLAGPRHPPLLSLHEADGPGLRVEPLEGSPGGCRRARAGDRSPPRPAGEAIPSSGAASEWRQGPRRRRRRRASSGAAVLEGRAPSTRPRRSARPLRTARSRQRSPPRPPSLSASGRTRLRQGEPDPARSRRSGGDARLYQGLEERRGHPAARASDTPPGKRKPASRRRRASGGRGPGQGRRQPEAAPGPRHRPRSPSS